MGLRNAWREKIIAPCWESSIIRRWTLHTTLGNHRGFPKPLRMQSTGVTR